MIFLVDYVYVNKLFYSCWINLKSFILLLPHFYGNVWFGGIDVFWLIEILHQLWVHCCEWCKKSVPFHSSACGSPIFSVPFVEETFFLSIGYAFLFCQDLWPQTSGSISGISNFSIYLYFCICASAIEYWLSQRCNLPWQPESGCLQPCFNFSVLLWLFELFVVP